MDTPPWLAWWRKEYLNTLQGRSKWRKDRRNVKVGDVIIKAKNSPRNTWLTGVIETVESASDGVVRACDVHTTQGNYRRAVCDLILLVPVSQECNGRSR